MAINTIIQILVLTIAGSWNTDLPAHDRRFHQSEQPSSSLPIDPQVRVDTLSNGLTYYIRRSHVPKNRCELMLVVKVGSVLEDEDQQGLAHFIEHMAFNGTYNVPKPDLAKFLESAGMRYGPDINAVTDFDRTIYKIQIPTDNEEFLNNAVRIIKGWIHQIRFDEGEIKKERDVILAELRASKNARVRLMEKTLRFLLNDSPYAGRFPMGRQAVLDSLNPRTIERFYREWYRPDKMAVIAVGDIDPYRLEELIRSEYSNIPQRTEAPRKDDVFAVEDYDEPIVEILQDSEATQSMVKVYYKTDLVPATSLSGYRQAILGNLVYSIVSDRLEDMSRRHDPPMLTGKMYPWRFIRSTKFQVVQAQVRDGGVEQGLSALMTEISRIKRHGISGQELRAHKEKISQFVERLYQRRNQIPSREFAKMYRLHFLFGDPIPGISFEFKAYRKLIPEIELQELNRFAYELFANKNRVILVSIPENSSTTTTNRERLAQTIAQSGRQDSPDERVFDAQPLLENPPSPGQIIREITNSALDVTEWHLSNGARVILKPTDFVNDEVLFGAFSPGGHSMLPDSSYIAAVTAASVIQAVGLGSVGGSEINAKLSGRLASLKPWIREYYEGFNGSASSAELEVLCQLVYLHFQEPRRDSLSYLNVKTRRRERILGRINSPVAVLEDTVRSILSQDYHRRIHRSIESLNEMHMDLSRRIYRERFSAAGNFTFFFVGDFNRDRLKRLVEAYIGSLPVTIRKKTSWNVDIKLPKRAIERNIFFGGSNRSVVQLVYSGLFKNGPNNRTLLQSLGTLLRINLRQKLRESMAKLYNINVSVSFSDPPEAVYQVSITFVCAPRHADYLGDVVLGQIDSLKHVGRIDPYLERIKTIQHRRQETEMRENRFWLESLSMLYKNDEDLQALLAYPAYIERLESPGLRSAAETYLRNDQYVKVILYPEDYKLTLLR